MLKQTFDGLGRSSPETDVDFRQLNQKGWVHGVRVAPESELDAFWLVRSTAQSQYNPAALSTAVAGGKTSVVAGGGLVIDELIKVSVERPFVGKLDLTQWRIAPARYWSNLFNDRTGANGDARAPMLAVDFLTDPEEVMWLPTKRAPLELDLTYRLNNGSTPSTLDLWVPIMGRKYVTVDVWTTVDTGTDVQTTGQLVKMWYDLSGGGTFRSGAATVIPATAGALDYEGDGEADFLKLSLARTVAANAPTWSAHIRAED